jgi:hypothetical protein
MENWYHLIQDCVNLLRNPKIRHLILKKAAQGLAQKQVLLVRLVGIDPHPKVLAVPRVN